MIGGARVEILKPEKSLLNNAELPFAKPACSMQPAEAELVFVGQGCSRGALPAVAANIAVFDAGGCTYYEKALNAQQAGAIAFIAARTAGARPDIGNEPITIPGVTISSEDLNFLRASREIVRARVPALTSDTASSCMLIFDMTLIWPSRDGCQQIEGRENTKRCPIKNAGWYSVRNPDVSSDIAYVSVVLRWRACHRRARDATRPCRGGARISSWSAANGPAVLDQRAYKGQR